MKVTRSPSSGTLELHEKFFHAREVIGVDEPLELGPLKRTLGQPLDGALDGLDVAEPDGLPHAPDELGSETGVQLYVAGACFASGGFALCLVVFGKRVDGANRFRQQLVEALETPLALGPLGRAATDARGDRPLQLRRRSSESSEILSIVFPTSRAYWR